MIDTNALISKYYSEEPKLHALLLKHSKQVADFAIEISNRHPELDIDKEFVYEAAMLHDIGIRWTNAPSIHCYGSEPYLKHGLLGSELLRKEGLGRHARVAERHTGTGLTCEQIIQQHLPIPAIDLSPETIEEKVICYADKFFSKSSPDIKKTIERVEHSLAKFGTEGVDRFKEWERMFG